MIDALRLQLTNLVSGGMSGMVQVILIALGIAFFWYVAFVKKDHKNPFWALIVLLMGIGVFAGFFFGGVKVGKIFGFAQFGAFVGIFAFFFLATIYKYYSTPKDKRRKRFM